MRYLPLLPQMACPLPLTEKMARLWIRRQEHESERGKSQKRLCTRWGVTGQHDYLDYQGLRNEVQHGNCFSDSEEQLAGPTFINAGFDFRTGSRRQWLLAGGDRQRQR